MFPEKINFYSKGYSLTEITQTVQISFSFIDKEGNQANPFFVCRDYAHDAIRTMHTGNPSSIYGFNYDRDTDVLINLEHTRMLIGKITAQEVADAIHLLHHYEDMAEVKRTKVKDYFVNGNKFYYFLSDKFWMSSSFHISLYTMLIRLGHKNITFKDNEELQTTFETLCEDPGWCGDNDISYLGPIRKIIDAFIIYKLDRNLYTEYSDLYINIFHDNGGIYSLATGISYDEQMNKEFVEDKVRCNDSF